MHVCHASYNVNTYFVYINELSSRDIFADIDTPYMNNPPPGGWRFPYLLGYLLGEIGERRCHVSVSIIYCFY